MVLRTITTDDKAYVSGDSGNDDVIIMEDDYIDRADSFLFDTKSDYNKVLTEGPWIMYGIGRVVRVDYNTQDGEQGKSTRLMVLVDLNKPLLLCIGIDGFVHKLKYEGLQQICFSCGVYEHLKDNCATMNPPASTNPTQENMTTNTRVVATLGPSGSRFNILAEESDKDTTTVSQTTLPDAIKCPSTKPIKNRNTILIHQPSMVRNGVSLNEAYLASNPTKKKKTPARMDSTLNVISLVEMEEVDVPHTTYQRSDKQTTILIVEK
ncbi:hypothetical protein GQ457_10G015090 [Hibiscus cannabinus]